MRQLLLTVFCGLLAFAVGVLAIRGIERPEEILEQPIPEVQPIPETQPEIEAAEEGTVLPVFAPLRSSFDERFHLPVLVEGELVSMSLRQCVLGAVLGEMPASFAPEALKAQAVACRTYAMRQYTHRKHEAAALCTDPGCCMNWVDPDQYRDSNGEAAFRAVEAAVEATDGMALYFDDELIVATFFSSSGGRTENAADVWGGSLPYLCAVDSPGEDSPWDPYQTRVPIETFVSVLTDANEMAVFPETGEDWFGDVNYTEGGGVAAAELGGCIYTGVQLRRLFHLPSTMFSVERRGDEVVFTSHGCGHRVGLSQYGANAMAGRGCGFQQILSWYYPGTELRTNP